MVKKYAKPVLHGFFILLLISLLLITFLQSRKSSTTTCQPLALEGQFCINDGAWQPLDCSSLPSPREGTLTVEGHFDRSMTTAWQLHLLLDHVDYSLSINGQLLSASDGWDWVPALDTCGRSWVTIPMPAVTAEDTIQLQLRSNHRFPAAAAYRTTLSSLYSGDFSGLRSLLQAQASPLCIAGLVAILLAILSLGSALAFSLLRVPHARRLWTLGLISLCLGAYAGLDSIALSVYPDLRATLTFGRILCLMLASLEFHLFLARELTEWRQKLTKITLYIHIVFVVGLLTLCFIKKALPFDFALFWGLFLLLLIVLLLVCCVQEVILFRHQRKAVLYAAPFTLLCTLAELIGRSFPAFPHGLLIKLLLFAATPILFVILLRQGTLYAIDNGQKAARSDALANELENSRIMLAMNQIRTHFIFNILNAISGMCKYDPAKADRTVVLFARFLRTNIDIMQTDTPVTFSSALRHVEDYIVLEQIRFGERLNFVTDIEEDFFCLPPLVLQPLIENAIKHGLPDKPEGGTITLRTWVEGDDVCVSVHDDGVGFDPAHAPRTGSVGLQNVRFRLQQTMNGSLTIDSEPGKGTTATIRIPLEEATKCM